LTRRCAGDGSTGLSESDAAKARQSGGGNWDHDVRVVAAAVAESGGDGPVEIGSGGGGCDAGHGAVLDRGSGGGGGGSGGGGCCCDHAEAPMLPGSGGGGNRQERVAAFVSCIISAVCIRERIRYFLRAGVKAVVCVCVCATIGRNTQPIRHVTHAHVISAGATTLNPTGPHAHTCTNITGLL
jgi:hypothetical protein